MNTNKKVLATALVAVTMVANSLGADFQCNADNNKTTISYQLNGKHHQAIELLATINGSKQPLPLTLQTTDNNPQSGKLAVKSGNKSGSLLFRFDKPSQSLILTKFTGIKKLSVKFTSSILVLPELNGDDLVVYPKLWKSDKLTIPGDNHLAVNMIDHGNAMISCIWNNPQLKIVQHKTKAGDNFSGIDLYPSRNDIFAISIDAAQHIWTIPTEKINKKVATIDWHPPFNAHWLVTLKKLQSDLKAENGHCDTWGLASLDKAKPHAGTKGVYITSNDGTAFTAEVGMFVYPFYQKQQQTYLFFPRYRTPNNHYDKSFPPLIYTLKAAKNAQTHKLLPYDRLEKLLNKKTLKELHNIASPHNRYSATCGNTKKIETIFFRGNVEQKQTAILNHCIDMNNFIYYYRQRVEEYRHWAKKIDQEMKIYVRTHPRDAVVIKQLRKELWEIEGLYAKANNKIKNPEYFKILTKQIIRLSTAKGDEEKIENECKRVCRKIRTIGGSQDHLVGMLHATVKAFRINVTLLLLENPNHDLQEMLKTLRQASATMLHVRYNMEGK
jgi:hypothetical protein